VAGELDVRNLVFYELWFTTPTGTVQGVAEIQRCFKLIRILLFPCYFVKDSNIFVVADRVYLAVASLLLSSLLASPSSYQPWVLGQRIASSKVVF
jgi:hypothetical protein